MRARFQLGAFVAVLFASLASPQIVRAGEPPNPNDPCSRGGRDICGTTGVGFYGDYKYGVRWFGDYRGSIPNAAHTFCIDLRYWYPSKAYPYRELDAETLKNRDGEEVGLASKRKLAYAIWAYGRSTNASRQAAVMLYVHGLMGDAAPGEVSPGAVGDPAVSRWYERIASDAERYHGPYRIETAFPGHVTLGQKTTARIRVLSATGHALPGLELALDAGGSAAVPSRVVTNASGVAEASVLPTKAGDLQIAVKTAPLASTLPTLYVATQPAAARNGQRLAVPAAQQPTATVDATVSQVKVTATSSATPKNVVVGQKVVDKVTIAGARPSYAGTVAVKVYGPFRQTSQVRCDGTPAARSTFKASGPGLYRTQPVAMTKPGLYTFQELLPGDRNHVGYLTPCRDPAELFRVAVRPDLRTLVSAQQSTPGAAIHDTVFVEGLMGEPVTVEAALYGPYANRAAITCTGKPVWTGSVPVTTDGQFQTADVTLTVPGYYTYRESIADGPFVRGVTSKCAEEAETSVVVGAPKLRTRVSALQTVPGKTITDKVVVTGLGVLSARVKVELFGPFKTDDAVKCTGRPYRVGGLTVKGDGTYTTAPVRLAKAGYYSYRESIVASAAMAGVTTACAQTSETTFAFGEPAVVTIVSHDVVLPGSKITDEIQVTGLGRTPVTIDVALFGPFRSRAAIRCSGKPFWTGTVAARGDGRVKTRPVAIRQVGFYTYREAIAESDLVAGADTECGLTAETSLARPLVITGRGDARTHAAATSKAARRPVRVELPALGIAAPVSPVVIDLKAGALGVGANIHRTGWWRDGALPGDPRGAVLIAGHVDSATAGPGAFKELHRAEIGDRVKVRAANGRTFSYRVVSVRTYRKNALPADIYSQRGKARLVLVTCGGPFNAILGHYRDNIVVTAVRA
jgi:LPXTG-site transpeptidase (sortase) family protein